MDRFLIATTIALALSVAGAAHAADPVKGKGIFSAQCGICHAANAGAASGIGPNLFGVVGRKAGGVAAFSYSSAMKNAGFVWSEIKLKAYISAPSQTVPGNKMPFAGIKNADQRDDIAAYLLTLK